jgi:hypothetical protein
MLREEQNMSMVQGRDCSSDSSSPEESTTSATGGSSSSLKGQALNESFPTSRPRQRTHATKKKKHIIRIVSKVPGNAKSLQELDEVVGYSTLSSSPKAQGHPKHTPEDEYYYDDGEFPISDTQRSRAVAASQNKEQELSCNLEEVKVVQHLMRPPPLAADMQSVWSSRSRSSSKSLRRKRGTSLEHEISRTILQTAVAGEAEAAHFLVETDVQANAGESALMVCTAQFILTDLFYEAARQKMEDALPEPSEADDEASVHSGNLATRDKTIHMLNDDPWFSLTPLKLPSTMNDNMNLISVYSKPIDDEEPQQDIVSSCGGIDMSIPVVQMLSPPRIGTLEHYDSAAFATSHDLMRPSQQTLFDSLVYLVSKSQPEKPAPIPLQFPHVGISDCHKQSLPHSTMVAIQDNINGGASEKGDTFESWVDFGTIGDTTCLGGSSLHLEICMTRADLLESEKGMGNMKNVELHEAEAVEPFELTAPPLDTQPKSMMSLINPRTNLVSTRDSTLKTKHFDYVKHGEIAFVGVLASHKVDMATEHDTQSRSNSPHLKHDEDVFDGLDFAATMSWIEFDEQSIELRRREAWNSFEQPQTTEESLDKRNSEAKIEESTSGSETWSPEERALYFQPTSELSQLTNLKQEVDSMNASVTHKLETIKLNQDGCKCDASFHQILANVANESSCWTNFDDIPTAFIANPFKNTSDSVPRTASPPTKSTKPCIPPPPQQPRFQKGQRKQWENETSQSSRNNNASSPDHSVNANISSIHYSPASVFDLELATKRALAKVPRLQPATPSGNESSF